MSTEDKGAMLLRQFTPARVALGRSGGSLPTTELLALRLAHARARDALLRQLDESALALALELASGSRVHRLSSAADSQKAYLLRPDLGRRLHYESESRLARSSQAPVDLAVIVSDGLSALAVETHAVPVVTALFPLLRGDGWNIGPICLVRRGRVAIQDHAGACMGAEFGLILLGERPGLASPDSLGAYIVRNPRQGNTDAQRNCVSNINRNGLSPEAAAAKLYWLLTEARRRKTSGIELKDEFDSRLLEGR